MSGKIVLGTLPFSCWASELSVALLKVPVRLSLALINLEMC